MSIAARSVKRSIARLLERAGYRLQRVDADPPPSLPPSDPRREFVAAARPFVERHRAQTAETVAMLDARYREPVFGVVPVWSVVEMLAHVVDPFDAKLGTASQEVHLLQLVEGMIADGVTDESLLLTAILHDVGKVLHLVGEDPANVFGSNEPIGDHAPGIGLDRCVMQWNHDEFGYSRFHALVPDHVGWLIRYHSMVPDRCVQLMDDRDRDYHDRYLRDFQRWERETKSMYRIPRTPLADYRGLVDAAFPEPIPF